MAFYSFITSLFPAVKAQDDIVNPQDVLKVNINCIDFAIQFISVEKRGQKARLCIMCST